MNNLTFQTHCQNFGCLPKIIQKLYKFENLTLIIFLLVMLVKPVLFIGVFARESKYSGEEMCEYGEVF